MIEISKTLSFFIETVSYTHLDVYKRQNQHIFGKKSFAKIAASEGKAKNTIQESYDAAIKKMKKFLKNTLPKDLPYSE